MADKKITELDTAAALDDTDVFPMTDDVGGTPTTKKVAWSAIKAAIKSYYDSVTATLTNKTLTGAKVDGLRETNGNKAFEITANASGVNYLTMRPGSTGQAVLLAAESIVDTDVYLNLTSQGSGTVRANGVDIATISGTQTLTNKSINASNNTITNLTTAMFASNVIDTDTSLTANSDTRLATQKAVKAYVTAAVAAGISDGDKGDITVSSSGTVFTIDNSVVTLAKMADIATASLLGRNTASTGAVEVLSASTVRTLLGLVIGTNVQAYDADLATIAGLTATTDNFLVSVSSAWASRTPAQVRTTLALVIGTNVQAWDADLDAIAALSPTNDDIIQRKSGAWTNRTMAQLKTDLALAKGDVGLGNVDNTSNATERAATRTLTNARITKREGTTASSSTPTPDSDAADLYTVTALAAGATFGAPTGTPTDGQELIIRIKDNGTARSLAFNSIYRFSSDLAAPTTTVLSKTIYMKFLYNFDDTKWDCVAWLSNF